MKSSLPIIFITMLSIIGCILFTNALLFADESANFNVAITATIRPMRVIVVDQTLTIKKVISNTKEDIRPMVVLDTEDGKELAYSDAIYTQYEDLKPTLNFSKPGILYERDNRPLQALFKALANKAGKILKMPF